MWDQDDTIAAIASAPGGAARGIVRLSGPRVLEPLAQRFHAKDGIDLSQLREATAVEGRFALDGFAARLPCTMYYWPGARSYTRQPVLEIHTLGSPPLLEALLRQLCASGARHAEPGEFTLRAFLAGRVDLTQAEAVLGAIDAATTGQFQVALTQMAGGLSGPLAALREQLLEMLAHLEAGLDFVEEDIEFISAETLLGQLDAAALHVGAIFNQMATRGQSQELAKVVLYGWPNVGKSSLLNRLAGRPEAIVAPQAGTTRDYLAIELDLGQMACQLIDTAGIEAAREANSIEALAQRLGGQQRSSAQITLLCLDASRPLNTWEQVELSAPSTTPRLVVTTKADAVHQANESLPHSAIATSAVTGGGIELLKQEIHAMLADSLAAEATTVAATAVRSSESLRLAAESLRRAAEAVREFAGDELVAAEIRLALIELGKVAGVVYTDDVLDRIFSRFCIGK
jgi:tRNA modification GTPase